MSTRLRCDNVVLTYIATAPYLVLIKNVLYCESKKREVAMGRVYIQVAETAPPLELW